MGPVLTPISAPNRWERKEVTKWSRRQLRSLDWGTRNTLLLMVKAMSAGSPDDTKRQTSIRSYGWVVKIVAIYIYMRDCEQQHNTNWGLMDCFVLCDRVWRTAEPPYELGGTRRKKQRGILRTGGRLLTWILMLSPPWLLKLHFSGNHRRTHNHF